MMMQQQLKPNFHQKKWLKCKHKLRLKPMLPQFLKLPSKLPIQMLLENFQLLKRHKSKLKLKPRLMLLKEPLRELQL